MLIGDWWIFPDGRALDMQSHEHAVLARRTMMKLQPNDYMAAWNIMKPLDAEELTLAESRGADDAALEFLSQDTPDPRWFAMKHWGWIRVHVNRKKGETIFQTLLFDDDALGVLRKSDFWKQQPQRQDSDWTIIEELATHRLFQMPVSKLLHGDPETVLGRAPASAEPSVAQVRAMYAERDNPGKISLEYDLAGIELTDVLKKFGYKTELGDFIDNGGDLILQNGVPVGWLYQNQTGVLEAMELFKPYRGRGIGKEVLDYVFEGQAFKAFLPTEDGLRFLKSYGSVSEIDADGYVTVKGAASRLKPQGGHTKHGL